MAENSVDDMYKDCSTEMEEQVKEYLKNEQNKDPVFKKTWTEAEEWYNHPNEKVKPDVKLSKEQNMALYAYTSSTEKIYKLFNEATREQGPEYKTTFKYHALHFYLTTALQTLRAHQKPCYNVYRRTRTYYSDNDVDNKKIRFGFFASSSEKNGHKGFGDKGCFKIKTCMGADVSKFSSYEQQEVLIPPYEVFTVTKITRRSQQRRLWCHVVYELKNTGDKSNLNCALFQK
ncbi:uncharacterized protein ACO6RY_05595 [Pungitius sinensis]